MKHSVFVLGLDGGSWNLLDRLLAAGRMPNLDRICREGVKATLESTVPPITPVAWSSLMTGANPGKHGVFGFFRASAESHYLLMPVNRLDLQVPTIFDYYQDPGCLISLNLPMSYPATPINGLMITGMMTPLGDDVRAQHPAGLLERFARAGITYTIDPKFMIGKDIHPQQMMQDWQQSGERFVAQLTDITRQRLRAVHLLMDQEEWDVFICVIVGTDRLQHVFWDKLMTPQADALDPILVSYYEQVDQQIGELAARLGPGEALFIISDHGFAACRGAFHTNAWLADHGWLSPASKQSGSWLRFKRFLKRCGIDRNALRRLVGERRLSRLQIVLGDVDWAHTAAFLGSAFGIRFNMKEREPKGLLSAAQRDELQEELVATLLALEDPQGRRPIARVFRSDEIYHGPAAAQAPDLVFTFDEEATYSAYAADLGKGVFAATPFKTGDHRLDGIFAAWGGGIRQVSGLPRFHIQDVLPTVMHLGGRAVPEICDGRVLTEILSAQTPIQRDGDWRRFQHGLSALQYGAEQAEEIKERLQALGYMSEDS